MEAAAAWAACGAEVVGGRQHRREVVGCDQATAASPRTRGCALSGTRDHGLALATGKWALPLNLFLKFQNQHNFFNLIW
jgi:hypothetical protein